MPLITRHEIPHGGFSYREPSLNWVTPQPILDFDLIVSQIQQVRMSNPASGLNPKWEACAAALDLYTCKRLNYDPRWCVPEPGIVQGSAPQPSVRVKRGCGSCGQRKRLTAPTIQPLS